MSEQDAVQKCMVIPDIIAQYPDEKIRFAFCRIAALFNNKKMIAQEPNDEARLRLCIEKLGFNESLSEKDGDDFFDLEGEVFEPTQEGEPAILKGKVLGVKQDFERRVSEKITPLECRLKVQEATIKELKSNVYEMAKILNVMAKNKGLFKDKPLVIDVKNLHIRDFVPKDEGESD